MNRLEFIKSVAAAASLPSLFGCAGFSSEPRGRMLFGACRGIDDAPLLKRLGYDFFEWPVAPALGPDKDAEWWRAQKERILAAPLPLRSCNGFLPGRFRLTGPAADHAPALDYAETALRRAAEVGVKTVVFGSGDARNVPGDFTNPNRRERPDIQKGTAQYADFCRELARRTADVEGVVVVIEPLCPNESNIVNFVWQGLAICRDIDSPKIAQLADLYHMTAGGESAESIVRAGTFLKHCHVAEVGTRAFPGSDPARTPLLKPYFAALRKIGYAGGVSCECNWGAAADLEKNLETALRALTPFQSGVVHEPIMV